MKKKIVVKIQNEDFDVKNELDIIRRNNPKIGAIVTFIGLVRDFNQKENISEMDLEHYPGMTEIVLEKIANEANDKWDCENILVIHRIGKLKPMDQIVLVIVCSAHRGKAFSACQFVIDFLKTKAPFWKREVTGVGSRWVEARESDLTSESKWH
tara:strand:+ start:566 stop:1027 length:462 start_codon:yes stop_codon:yes gene_type:complete